MEPIIEALHEDIRRLRARISNCDMQLSLVLHELAGAASLCWDPKPTGVFDTSLAIEHVERSIKLLRGLLRN